MASCPECNAELDGTPTHCHVCGCELVTEDLADWEVLGSIENRMWAESARETLRSSGIPSTVISKSGFFGNAGLPLNPIYESKDATFQISVPTVHTSEAGELLDMTLGDNWQRRKK
ncbi:MAG: hypothetical protein KOO62_06225 [candidate division Zixibacteria bacterium]|nr:hypothetical protein [candidate division Zixibacteria bacterium]